jgi:hypothetical protein
MPKRSSKDSDDPNVIAFRVVQQATGTAPKRPARKRKNPAAVALGRRGGKKGGKARAAKLSPERRAQIAKQAAMARWGTVEPPK